MVSEFGVTRQPPSGAIAIWGDSLSSIPSGWVVCDGNNGTPNLLDEFIQSVPDGNTDPGTTGGEKNKTLTVSQIPSHSHNHDSQTSTDGSHTHTFPANEDSTAGSLGELENANSGSTVSSTTDGAHTHGSSVSSTGGGSSFSNEPPYYEVAFIMKV